jgi:hypothetical protein
MGSSELKWLSSAATTFAVPLAPSSASSNLTSHLLAQGQLKEAIKNDLGWSSVEMVERYGHDLPGLGKARANLVQFGSDTNLTHAKKKKAKK